jgi:hypothetical protein
MRQAKMWLLLGAVAAACAACGAAPQLPAPTPAPSATILWPTATPSPSQVTGTSSPARPSPTAVSGSVEPTATAVMGVDVVVEIAIRDLSRRLSVDPAQIVVKSSQAVSWPDTALGCPQPGMMYAQVITPGHKLVLTIGGKDYTYHTSKSQAVLCGFGM